MNEEQRKFFTLPFDEREPVFFEKFPDGKLLKEKLLAIGGDSVVWMYEDAHMDALIKSGKSFDVTKSKKIKGEFNRCHTNAAKLFLEKDYSIVTGYALSDNRWIQHSWGFDGKKIIETTVKFNAYYGVILSGLDITKFIAGNLGNEIFDMPKELLRKLPMPENIKDLV